MLEESRLPLAHHNLFVQLMLLEIDGLLLWQPELPSQDFLHSHALQFTSVLVYTTAEIVSLTFDLYLMNVGSPRIGELLDYLGVKTVTGTTWESGTINGMLCNEKYKGDFHLQKYYTSENKRNHTKKNNGEEQSYYISENHEPIVSPEV